MTDYSRKLGRSRFGRFMPDAAQPSAMPTLEWRRVHSFAGGYDASDVRQNIPENASPYILDMDVTDFDRLVRAPGVSQAEPLTGHNSTTQMMFHPSLDYTAELLFIDAPHLGIKKHLNTVWSDQALVAAPAGKRYAYATYGEDLIFSPGVTSAYKRSPNSGVVTVLAEAPPAETYATFAGRLFAGAPVVDGVKQPLALLWNAAVGDIDDWTGIGSGYELLIENAASGDKVVALRSVNFDLLAIFCRRSIWVGTRTGDLDRPADFQIRHQGSGPLHDEAVAVTPQGVAYLSDSGVFIFDGNTSTLISEKINPQLLPLDLTQEAKHTLYYHAVNKKLYVMTPTATWIFSFEKMRWTRRGLVAKGATLFAQQYVSSPQSDNYSLYFLGMNAGVASLGVEDATYDKYFDLAMTPTWEFPLMHGPYMNQIIMNQEILLEYEGAGTIEFWHPDVNGEYVAVVQKEMISGGGGNKQTKYTYQYSSLGLGARVKILSGFPKISAIDFGFIPQGPRLETGTFAAREYYEDFQS